MRFALSRMAACLRYWPQLAAIYVLGQLVRDGAISLAAWAGHDNDVWAALIMPVAVLARLGSLVAMFLVLRPAFPEFAADPAQQKRPVNLFASVILPAFAIYLGWKMFKEDWLTFEARALHYRVDQAISTAAPTELHPDLLPASHVTIAIICAALVARTILHRLADSLPRWTVALRVYVDAVWTFLVLTLSATEGVKLLTDPTGWVKERRVVVWLGDLTDSVVSQFHPLQVAWKAVNGAVTAILGGAAVPLIWLAVAGIIYGLSIRTSWPGAAHRIGGERADAIMQDTARRTENVRSQWKSMPKPVRDKGREYALSKFGKYRPLAESARLIAHAGLLGLAVYVLAYLVLAWLDMSGSFYTGQLAPGYLYRGMALLLGPHGIEFWNGVDGALAFASHLIVEPLRICVIATAFGYCVHHAAQSASEHQPQQDPAV